MNDIIFHGFEKGSRPPRLVEHHFAKLADGSVAHVIDTQLRAIIPPEGWEAYEATYPDARSVFDAARADTASAEMVRVAAAKAAADAAAAAAAAAAQAEAQP